VEELKNKATNLESPVEYSAKRRNCEKKRKNERLASCLQIEVAELFQRKIGLGALKSPLAAAVSREKRGCRNAGEERMNS
jgi:hypothetical protein